MKEFESIDFNPEICRKELKEFKKLLDDNKDLNERGDILPFFKKNKHLSVFIGSYFPDIINFGKIAYVFSIYGDFVIKRNCVAESVMKSSIADLN